MLLAALTGNIASGKSTVARWLEERGAMLIDADVLARDVVAPGSEALGEIVGRWGGGVLSSDGSLDRQALRRIVFGDPRELDALNRIVHPRVEALRLTRVREARERGAGIVICDIPLLFESGMERAFDLVILVDAPRDVRRARLIQRRALSAEEADAMIAAQRPSGEKRARSTIIVENAGSLEALATRVEAVWNELQERADTDASGM